jgi:enoyl-CoA hydratase/carnithine racemase
MHSSIGSLTDLSTERSVAVICFAPEPAYPRLTRSALDEIRDHLDSVRRSELFRAVVVGSNHRSFATGAALEEIAELEGVQAREFALAGQSLFREIERYPLPVVAAIRGFCMGGGLDLALACHGRVAAYDSSFAHPGPARGLMTGWGGTARLPRLIGKPGALEVLLTGERIPATQALAWGLVDALVPATDLIATTVDRALALAERRALRLAWQP